MLTSTVRALSYLQSPGISLPPLPQWLQGIRNLPQQILHIGSDNLLTPYAPQQAVWKITDNDRQVTELVGNQPQGSSRHQLVRIHGD
jgi:hypothetical protein